MLLLHFLSITRLNIRQKRYIRKMGHKMLKMKEIRKKEPTKHSMHEINPKKMVASADKESA